MAGENQPEMVPQKLSFEGQFNPSQAIMDGQQLRTDLLNGTATNGQTPTEHTYSKPDRSGVALLAFLEIGFSCAATIQIKLYLLIPPRHPKFTLD